MLGFYANFPKNIQKLAYYTFSVSSKRLQQTLTEAFYKLNGETLNLEDITTPSIPRCIVIFEFGIAENDGFTFLETTEKDAMLESINKKTLQIMDFLCAIRYYKVQNGRKAALRFDYYLLRFIFGQGSLEMRVFHERGPMRISPEEITTFAIGKINDGFSKRTLKMLKEN